MKKALSLLLAAVLALSLFSVPAFPASNVINDAAELRTAAQTGGSYELGCDINLSGDYVTIMNDFELDFKGFTITGASLTGAYGLHVFYTDNTNPVSVILRNGKIVSENDCVYCWGYDFTFEDMTFESTGTGYNEGAIHIGALSPLHPKAVLHLKNVTATNADTSHVLTVEYSGDVSIDLEGSNRLDGIYLETYGLLTGNAAFAGTGVLDVENIATVDYDLKSMISAATDEYFTTGGGTRYTVVNIPSSMTETPVADGTMREVPSALTDEDKAAILTDPRMKEVMTEEIIVYTPAREILRDTSDIDLAFQIPVGSQSGYYTYKLMRKHMGVWEEVACSVDENYVLTATANKFSRYSIILIDGTPAPVSLSHSGGGDTDTVYVGGAAPAEENPVTGASPLMSLVLKVFNLFQLY